jgi:N-acetylglucosamine-6-phosphate deacetylase
MSTESSPLIGLRTVIADHVYGYVGHTPAPTALTLSPTGRIETLHSALPAEDNKPIFDASGCTVLPGFVDVHIHGSDGSDCMDATPEALVAISRFVATSGVTAFLATTMTAPAAPTLAAVRNAANVNPDKLPGARLLGVHLEGPFLSPEFPGAQPIEYVRDPDLAEFEELLNAGPVKLITLAPERPGAVELIDVARHRGVRLVMGHTAAGYDEAIAAIDRGVLQATHTFNAMTGLHHRKPGVVGAVLSDDRVFAQLIADNIHVHPAVMKVLARCKGAERTLLITDAIRAAGLPEGDTELGGQPVTVKDGACRLPDGTLAGSILTMDLALRNFLSASGWTLAEAWPVTSRAAATALGLNHEIGVLAPGYRADLAILDDKLEVVATVVGGKVVYVREGEERRLRD